MLLHEGNRKIKKGGKKCRNDERMKKFMNLFRRFVKKD